MRIGSARAQQAPLIWRLCALPRVFKHLFDSIDLLEHSSNMRLNLSFDHGCGGNALWLAPKQVDSSWTDEALMDAYLDGDDAAFRVLFERYSPLLFRLTRPQLPSDELAEETLQQTFFRLHRARHSFRRGSTVRPWIITIAKNLVREYWRTSQTRKTTSLDAETHVAPEVELTAMELRQRSRLLHRALERLPDSQRVVLELHWFEDRPYAEVAHMIGTSEGAVRVRAHRACVTLHRLLAPEMNGMGQDGGQP